jgi:hypothetical protein
LNFIIGKPDLYDYGSLAFGAATQINNVSIGAFIPSYIDKKMVIVCPKAMMIFSDPDGLG